MKLTLIALLITLNLTTVFAQDEANEVVAEVNGKKITKRELLSYHKANLNFVRMNKPVTLERSLDDLINKIVGIDRAKKNNLDKNLIVKKKMEDILYHAQISRDLDDKLMSIKVEDSEVKKYYKENPEYKTSQILFRLRTQPSKEEVANTLDTALKIYAQIKETPKKFEEFAASYSQSSTSLSGGDLGYQPKTRLTPEYYEQIKNKKIGHISKPFRSQYGYHIVKVTGVKTYDQIEKNMYKKIIYDVKRDKILEKYFKDLQKKAKIKINKKVLNELK